MKTKMKTYYEVAEEDTEFIHTAYLGGDKSEEVEKQRHVSLEIY